MGFGVESMITDSNAADIAAYEDRMLEPDDLPPNVRIVPCEECGTEGRIYLRRFGSTLPDDVYDAGACPVCGGECSVIVEVQSIEMEDLDVNDPA
jgi:hypothetical protein